MDHETWYKWTKEQEKICREESEKWYLRAEAISYERSLLHWLHGDLTERILKMKNEEEIK